MSDLVGTVQQVAARLETSPWTIYRMCRSGKLPHWRLGGDIRGQIVIPWHALEQWIDEQSRATAEAARRTIPPFQE